MFRGISITWWDASCAVNWLWILHWAVGFKNRMAYVQERCVLLFGDLAGFLKNFIQLSRAPSDLVYFPEHLSALPQSSARISWNDWNSQGAATAACNACAWPCLLLESEEKQLGLRWGREFHSQRGKRAAVCLGKNSAENGNVQTVKRRQRCSPSQIKLELISYLLIRS